METSEEQQTVAQHKARLLAALVKAVPPRMRNQIMGTEYFKARLDEATATPRYAACYEEEYQQRIFGMLTGYWSAGVISTEAASELSTMALNTFEQWRVEIKSTHQRLG